MSSSSSSSKNPHQGQILMEGEHSVGSKIFGIVQKVTNTDGSGRPDSGESGSPKGTFVDKVKRAMNTNQKRACRRKAPCMIELRQHLLKHDSNVLRIWRNCFDPYLHLRVAFRDFCKGCNKIGFNSDVV